MAITYTYKVTAVRVQSENGLDDVVKEVDVIVTGADGAATFSLPASLKVGSPNPEDFTSFGDLTEEQIVAWLDAPPTPGVPAALESIKQHIAYVAAKEAERLAMEQKPLPWAPAQTLPPAPTVPPAA